MKSPAHFSFRPIWISICGAMYAGSVMGILNFLVEAIKGNSIFKFDDLFHICLWYWLITFYFGALIGILCSFAQVIIKKRIYINAQRIMIIYGFFGSWILILSYINQYFLPLVFSLQSIVFNIFFMLVGAAIYFSLRKVLKILSHKTIINFVGLSIAVFLSVFGISGIINFIPLGKDENRPHHRNSFGQNNMNVILIVLDAVRYDHLSCYGYPRKTSPFIDQLAAHGVLFENAYSPSSHTLESISSLLTSTYSMTHNVISTANALPPSLITLPQVLKYAGYKTAIFSVNPNVTSFHGFDRGVDDFYGPQTNKIMNCSFSYILLNLSNIVPALDLFYKSYLRFSLSFFYSKQSLVSWKPEDVNNQIELWVRRNGQTPFFLYVHYDGGHNPYNPPNEYRNKFIDHNAKVPVTEYPHDLGMFLPFSKGKPISEEKRLSMISQYDAKVLYHDDSLRSLIDYFEKHNMLRDSLLIITADHGEEFYDHNAWGHGHSLFEELIHIPLIFYCPGAFPEGKRIDELVNLIDVFPTIMGLCKIEITLVPNHQIIGKDQKNKILSSETDDSDEFIFAEVNKGGSYAKCLKTTSLKAIIVNYGTKEKKLLYDLISDPKENNSIYENNNEKKEDLFYKIEKIKKETKKLKATKRKIDESMKEHFKTLGYIK